MARSGRKHGVVRTFTTTVGGDESPPPTSSKFTGKCGVPRCKEWHIHPCTKSKDKAKGTQKFRSNDVTSNHRLVLWAVVGGGCLLRSNGFSATGVLDRLVSVDRYFNADEARREINDDDDEIEDHI